MHWLPEYLKNYGVDILDKRKNSLEKVISSLKKSKIKFNSLYEASNLETITESFIQTIRYSQARAIMFQKIQENIYFPFEFKFMFIYSQLEIMEVRKLSLLMICLYLRFVSYNEDVAKSMGYKVKDGWIRIINHVDDIGIQSRNESKILSENFNNKSGQMNALDKEKLNLVNDKKLLFYYFNVVDQTKFVLEKNTDEINKDLTDYRSVSKKYKWLRNFDEEKLNEFYTHFDSAFLPDLNDQMIFIPVLDTASHAHIKVRIHEEYETEMKAFENALTPGLPLDKSSKRLIDDDNNSIPKSTKVVSELESELNSPDINKQSNHSFTSISPNKNDNLQIFRKKSIHEENELKRNNSRKILLKSQGIIIPSNRTINSQVDHNNVAEIATKKYGLSKSNTIDSEQPSRYKGKKGITKLATFSPNLTGENKFKTQLKAISVKEDSKNEYQKNMNLYKKKLVDNKKLIAIDDKNKMALNKSYIGSHKTISEESVHLKNQMQKGCKSIPFKNKTKELKLFSPFRVTNCNYYQRNTNEIFNKLKEKSNKYQLSKTQDNLNISKNDSKIQSPGKNYNKNLNNIYSKHTNDVSVSFGDGYNDSNKFNYTQHSFTKRMKLKLLHQSKFDELNAQLYRTTICSPIEELNQKSIQEVADVRSKSWQSEYYSKIKEEKYKFDGLLDKIMYEKKRTIATNRKLLESLNKDKTKNKDKQIDNLKGSLLDVYKPIQPVRRKYKKLHLLTEEDYLSENDKGSSSAESVKSEDEKQRELRDKLDKKHIGQIFLDISNKESYVKKQLKKWDFKKPVEMGKKLETGVKRTNTTQKQWQNRECGYYEQKLLRTIVPEVKSPQKTKKGALDSLSLLRKKPDLKITIGNKKNKEPDNNNSYLSATPTLNDKFFESLATIEEKSVSSPIQSPKKMMSNNNIFSNLILNQNNIDNTSNKKKQARIKSPEFFQAKKIS